MEDSEALKWLETKSGGGKRILSLFPNEVQRTLWFEPLVYFRFFPRVSQPVVEEANGGYAMEGAI